MSGRRTGQATAFSRVWSMPSADTFQMPPVRDLLAKWLSGCELIVDPFARNAKWGTLTNDLNPATTADCHLPAEEFCAGLVTQGVVADAAIFDPPYSPRQIAEVYQQIGRVCGQRDTQNARIFAEVKDSLAQVIRPGGIAICCGWQSGGFGKGRGFELLEILLVPHGGAHNDTIVTVERKVADEQLTFAALPSPSAEQAAGRKGAPR